MPTLRSQTAASASGNAMKNSDISEQGDKTTVAAPVFSNPSPPGPGTPAQYHEAGVPNSANAIRRSRRLSSMTAVDVTHFKDRRRKVSRWEALASSADEVCASLPVNKGKSKASRWEALASRVDEGRASLPVNKGKRKASRWEAVARRTDEGCMSLPVNKGKRKAQENLEEAFSEFSCGKTSLAGLGTKLEESSFNSQVGIENSDFSSKPSPDFLRKACDQEGLASSSKGNGRGRGSRGLEAKLGNGIPDHQSKQPQSLHGSSSSESDDICKVPNAERLLAAGQISVRHDFDSSAEDSDATMLGNKETALSDLEAGPSNRPQAEVGRRRRGARGRGRRGGAEASRSRFLQIARDRAFHFAHFNADGDEAPAGVPPRQAGNGRRRGRPPSHQLNQNRPQPPPQAQQVDWPGPFSTARQLVNNRAEAAAARQNAGAPGRKVSLVDWHPTRVHGDSAFCSRKYPSLQDLCLNVLSNNAENVSSLEGVPELVRFRISNAFCERRKMSAKLLSLFFQGEPSELHSLDCTQISEDELTAMMKQVSPSRLEKLHLDNCGRALSERCVLATIASPSSVTLLKSISLRGSYRLSDGGLEALLRASPQLVHLDLSACSFLTNASIKAIACCIGGTLESLVLDGCPNLNATAFVHDLVRLQKVQKISLAEVGGVTDEVVTEICVQLGSHLRELVLACCKALTDVAIAAIGPCCPTLQRLDLAHLSLLTDVAIAHITDNLRNIQVLNVRKCKFSDEAIAAFVTASGAALRNLSLNAVHQVADQTILALARHSHACLECLDLSFCRLVDDECLGFLADTCLQLQELKLYGCTQVTDKFSNGHSNLNLRVVGLSNSV